MKKIKTLKLIRFIVVFCLLFFCTSAAFAIERTESIKLYRAEDIIGSAKDKGDNLILKYNDFLILI